MDVIVRPDDLIRYKNSLRGTVVYKETMFDKDGFVMTAKINKNDLCTILSVLIHGLIIEIYVICPSGLGWTVFGEDFQKLRR